MKTYIPDTSAIIDGLVSELIETKKVKSGKILVHRAVIAELEHQANFGKEKGFWGLEELKKLNGLKSKTIKIEFAGERPQEFQIKNARAGEIDALIRETALGNKDAILITRDKVDSETALATGIKVIYIEQPKEEKELGFEKYFDKNTMSVHLREGALVHAKKGRPGQWEYVKISKDKLSAEELEATAKNIIEHAKFRIGNSFLETERKNSYVAQIEDYRIVITKPPFSDGWEITIVRPVKKMSLDEYKLDKKIMELFETKAEGVLISGAPGNGKSTFAQALAEFYKNKNKVVKTVEAPRDLKLSPEITQYSKALGTMDEIRDVLLLSRPDYTIFDEMRNNPDFALYADMRLAGVGMIGIVHATSPIDAVQRFIKRVELGVIPSIIDTVIFIQNGDVAKVYSLNMTVKTPEGMTERDLARPVVEIKDYFTGQPEYEMYTYGEATVVMAVKKRIDNAEKEIRKRINVSADIEIKGGVATVYVKKKHVKEIIGRKGQTIKSIEKDVGMPIDIVGY